jgi:exosome complex component RRP46
VASVSGPIEVRPQSELPSQATFEVVVRPLSGVPGTRAKSAGATLQRILSPSIILTAHPRTLLQLVVQQLKSTSSAASSSSKKTLPSDGLSELAAMINASTLALLDAGSIQMCGVVCAVAVGVDSSGSILLDPTDSEIPYLGAGGCFAFLVCKTELVPGESISCEPIWAKWQVHSQASVKSSDMLGRARDTAKRAIPYLWDCMKMSIPNLGTKSPSAAKFASQNHPPKVEVKNVYDEDDSDDEGSEGGGMHD